MNQRKLLALVGIAAIVVTGCQKDLEGTKYARPDWLAGKVYTQLKAEEDLSLFAQCITLAGYDTIIDRSGSYSVFAPTDAAVSAYLASHPEYGNSVENIPKEELSRIVKYHIVQNPWSKLQLTSLDIYGWIDTLDVNNDEPRGFKRQTLLLEEDRKYGVAFDPLKGYYYILDTSKTNWDRRVMTDSRKYIPFFYQEFFDIYDLKTSDYEFYFDRPFGGSGEIYFAGAHIEGAEIFAENGFVYKVDKVVEPLRNVSQILHEGDGQNSYTTFLSLLNISPRFRYDEEETEKQPGALQGKTVDSLFTLEFPNLTFDFNNEKTTAPRGAIGLPSEVTIRYHHGMMAPTNEAISNLVSEYLSASDRWGDLKSSPVNIMRIIANTHLSENLVFPSDFTEGFINGEQDKVILDESNIVHKEFGSNASFIGLSEAIVPRAFKAVTGPIYLKRGYSFAMNAIELTGLLPALKRENKDYVLYVESDDNCRLDSSFIYSPGSRTFTAYLTPDFGPRTRMPFTYDDVRTMLLNHVGLSHPQGIARKEFIKNLAGNYLVFNNETGQVTGTAETTEGFGGTVSIDFPTQISTDADNGTTYDIDNWFSFSAATLFTTIRDYYPNFHHLLDVADLWKDNFSYDFISESENYTFLLPNDTIWDSYPTDTLSQEELQKLLLNHVVQGQLIFTDGNQPSGYYETLRIDEKTTEFNTFYTKIYLDTDYDFIRIRAKGGGDYVTIEEAGDKTNLMTGRDIGEGTENVAVIVTNGVIHEIGKILVKGELDTDY